MDKEVVETKAEVGGGVGGAGGRQRADVPLRPLQLRPPLAAEPRGAPRRLPASPDDETGGEDRKCDRRRLNVGGGLAVRRKDEGTDGEAALMVSAAELSRYLN